MPLYSVDIFQRYPTDVGPTDPALSSLFGATGEWAVIFGENGTAGLLDVLKDGADSYSVDSGAVFQVLTSDQVAALPNYISEIEAYNSYGSGDNPGSYTPGYDLEINSALFPADFVPEDGGSVTPPGNTSGDSPP